MSKRTMNIAMLGQKAVPSRAGGIEVAVEALSTRMAAQGHRVTCYNRRDDRQSERNYRGVVLRQVPTIQKKGLAAVTSSFFAALQAAFSDAELVHIHAEGPALMCWIPKVFGKAVVVTVHGLDWQRAKWKGGLGARYIRLGERAAVRFADEIIVLSENMHRYFDERYHRRTVPVPNGVELPDAVPLPPPFGLAKDGYFLYLGRMVPEKGIHWLIEAFSGCRTEKKLVIAGAAPDGDSYADALRQQARGDSRIFFTGFVEGEQLQALYGNAYCYVLPSELEGMPLSLLEAMSYGNCCVVSDIPECREVVEDAAPLFPVGNTAALARLLQHLCDAPEEVAEYRRATSCLVRTKPDWDAVTGLTLQVYRKALEGRHYENSADQ